MRFRSFSESFENCKWRKFTDTFIKKLRISHPCVAFTDSTMSTFHRTVLCPYFNDPYLQPLEVEVNDNIVKKDFLFQAQVVPVGDGHGIRTGSWKATIASRGGHSLRQRG